MIDAGKRPVLGVGVNVVDYDGAVEAIAKAAHERKPFGVSALAVHGVMMGVPETIPSVEGVQPSGTPMSISYCGSTRWAEI